MILLIREKKIFFAEWIKRFIHSIFKFSRFRENYFQQFPVNGRFNDISVKEEKKRHIQ